MCRSKRAEQSKNIGIINSTTQSHLVGYLYMICIMMHGSMNIKQVTLSRLCWLHLLLKPNNLCPVSVVLLHFIYLYAIIRSDLSTFFTQGGIYLAFFKNYSFAQLIPLLCTFSVSPSSTFLNVVELIGDLIFIAQLKNCFCKLKLLWNLLVTDLMNLNWQIYCCSEMFDSFVLLNLSLMFVSRNIIIFVTLKSSENATCQYETKICIIVCGT